MPDWNHPGEDRDPTGRFGADDDLDDQDTSAVPTQVRPPMARPAFPARPAAPVHARSQPPPTPRSQPPSAPGSRPNGAAPAPVVLEEPPHEGQWVPSFGFRRSRTYTFVLDANGRPIEIGSGRYARVYLAQEQWHESLTELHRLVVIKMLHKNIAPVDAARFRAEKEILERVQGHPGIVELLGSGTSNDPRLPGAISAVCEGEFVILEKLDMNLEERLKGTRDPNAREDLAALDMHDRLLRVLEYILPIASAVEYAHVIRNVSHRDINPANILLRLPDPNLAGSKLEIRLADFGVAKAADVPTNMTRAAHGVSGAMYFQSPEQDTNILELLVSVTQGSVEVDYFEDFYISVAKNDTFGIFNRRETYPVLYADRARRKIILASPYREPSESNVRGLVQKAVGRPADIYSLGALLYYLISGATANPKALHDTFRKFIEYERADESNTIDAYLRHEYEVIDSIRLAKGQGAADIALDNRFFGYKHFIDPNGELIHFAVMMIVARAMIRNKSDSYCQAHDLETRGVSLLVRDLMGLYSLYGLAGAVPPQIPIRSDAVTPPRLRSGGMLRQIYEDVVRTFRRR